MASEGNGTLYQISFSGLIAQELKKLSKHAKAAGVGKEFVEALELAVFRMRHDPWGFGEMVGRLHHAKAVIHVRLVKPLLIEFAILEEKPIVFIKRVQLMV
jgi:hypothetical protein